MTGSFTAYDLRTTDLDQAEAFYAEVAGWQVRRSGAGRELFSADERIGKITLLPEPARARGVPAHWLGQISVEDVKTVSERVVALGGQTLGPAQQSADGTQIIALRDPQGAVFAIRSPPKSERPRAVAWHELYATDWPRSWALYAELFRWRQTQTLDLGAPVGTYQTFGWAESEQSGGAMGNMALLPGVHPQWLFYIAVPDLDAALTSVRRLGGFVANGPLETPFGARVAQCEDPQRAAFGLHASRG